MKILKLRSLAKYLAAAGAIGVMAIGALLPATAFAASNQSTKCAASDVKCVISAGDTQITNRQSALTKLNGKVSSDLSAHKINSDQASALQSDVSTNQTGLTNLKAKLDAETSATAARADYVNIYQQFRIYAVVLPRDYRHLQMDVEMNARGVMQTVAPEIKAAIANAPASKQSQLNALYSDYQNQVAAAESQLDTAQQDFPAMTPENFNQNRASYESTRQALDNALKTASADLHKAAKDLKQMAQILGF
jgi:hypothetical protein